MCARSLCLPKLPILQYLPFSEDPVRNLTLLAIPAYAAALFGGLGFRAGVNVVQAGFLWGAGVGHIRELNATGNLAPGNVGPILFTDFLTPAIVFVLLWLAWRGRGRI